MPTIAQRDALSALTKPRLLEIAGELGLGLPGRLLKSELVGAIAASPRAPLPRILELLKRDELKAICRAAGLDHSGREKAVIADRILGRADGDTVTLTKADLIEAVAAEAGVTQEDRRGHGLRCAGCGAPTWAVPLELTGPVPRGLRRSRAFGLPPRQRKAGLPAARCRLPGSSRSAIPGATATLFPGRCSRIRTATECSSLAKTQTNRWNRFRASLPGFSRRSAGFLRRSGRGCKKPSTSSIRVSRTIRS